MISVVIPCFNESDKLSATVRSIARTRTSGLPVEIIVVDDASNDRCGVEFKYEASVLSRDAFRIRILHCSKRIGNYRARNRGADAARGKILVCTDAHVRFGDGWDTAILRQLDAHTILSGVVASAEGGFRAYGLRLDVPSMWTVWDRLPSKRAGRTVGIAPCAATAMFRDTFLNLGGYDEGMLLYAGGEGEFSVRAWLAGFDLALCRDFVTYHRFKPKQELQDYLDLHRVEIVHNLLRFALLYLEPRQVRVVLRHHYGRRQAVCRTALEELDLALVRVKRNQHADLFVRDFPWLAQKLELPAFA